MQTDSELITRLLRQETPDYEALMPLVYRELRNLAQHRLRGERADHTLSATALVHEAYVRMTAGSEIAWENRAHFYHVAASAMRRVLVDHARGRARLKRGSGRRALQHAEFEPEARNLIDLAQQDDLDTILILDDALSRLEQEDDRLATVVRLRFFAGLTVEETAAALGLSEPTVKRRWAFARAWLVREVRGRHGESTGSVTGAAGVQTELGGTQ